VTIQVLAVHQCAADPAVRSRTEQPVVASRRDRAGCVDRGRELAPGWWHTLDLGGRGLRLWSLGEAAGQACPEEARTRRTSDGNWIRRRCERWHMPAWTIRTRPSSGCKTRP